MSNFTERDAGSLATPAHPPQARIARVVSDASGRVGKVMGEAASDIAMVVRDEVGRLATLFRPEVLTVGKGLAALAIAALGGLMALVFANVALLDLLTEMWSLPGAALILAAIWGAVALLGLRSARAQVQRLMDLTGDRKGTPRPPPPG